MHTYTHTHTKQGAGAGFTTQGQDKDVWFVGILTVTDGRPEFRMATPADSDQQLAPNLSSGGSQELFSWNAKKLARDSAVGARSVVGSTGNVLAMKEVCVCVCVCVCVHILVYIYLRTCICTVHACAEILFTPEYMHACMHAHILCMHTYRQDDTHTLSLSLISTR
jgi:hypothetical protein